MARFTQAEEPRFQTVVDAGVSGRHFQPEPETVLTVSDLRKSFISSAGIRTEVLRGIDMSAHRAEMIAITGASGSGKSTLLQLLGGLDEADHGSVLINGFDLCAARGPRITQFRGERIGFVFQFHHLIPDLNAEENVALPLLIARVPLRAALIRAGQALDSIGLANHRHQPITHLSGGEQQRIAVARALIREPMIVLADEPTGNLDAEKTQELASLLSTYARTRQALVIVATHNIALAEHCDRILTIQSGRLRPLSN